MKANINVYVKKSSQLAIEYHPFEPYIFNISSKLIIGTFPGKIFTHPNKTIFTDDFYYGTSRNKFWTILSYIFNKNKLVVSKREKEILLEKNQLGLIDIVKSAIRINNKNTDNNLFVKQFIDIPKILNDFDSIKICYFTSKSCFKIFLNIFKNQIILRYPQYDHDRNIKKIYLKEFKKEMFCIVLPTTAYYPKLKEEEIIKIYDEYLNLKFSEIKKRYESQ